MFYSQFLPLNSPKFFYLNSKFGHQGGNDSTRKWSYHVNNITMVTWKPWTSGSIRYFRFNRYLKMAAKICEKSEEQEQEQEILFIHILCWYFWTTYILVSRNLFWSWGGERVNVTHKHTNRQTHRQRDNSKTWNNSPRFACEEYFQYGSNKSWSSPYWHLSTMLTVKLQLRVTYL